MTKGYPIFEWIPGIPITDKDDQTQSEEDEISSTHKDEHDDEITKKIEDEESIEDGNYHGSVLSMWASLDLEQAGEFGG